VSDRINQFRRAMEIGKTLREVDRAVLFSQAAHHRKDADAG
jgi:hypothetical protein